MIEENLKRKQILACIVEETYLFTQHREESGKFCKITMSMKIIKLEPKIF